MRIKKSIEIIGTNNYLEFKNQYNGHINMNFKFRLNTHGINWIYNINRKLLVSLKMRDNDLIFFSIVKLY